jgi:hypothetical protein
MVRRSLSEGNHEEDHDHSHHDHSDNEFDASNIEDTIADLKQSLRGSGAELHLGKRRRVQGSSFSHWVDVYIEIDHALCSSNLDVCFWEVGPRTVNYSELGVQFHRSGYHFSLLNLNQSFGFFFFNIRIQ